jgi:uncharacterized protein YodC (DUF2158 family)
MPKDPESCEIGDVVYLKSGGEPMTVEFVGVNGDVILVWLDDAGHVNRAAISAPLLTKEL